MRYVATKYKVSDNWYPADLEKNTRVLEYLLWQPMAIRSKGVTIFLDLVSRRAIQVNKLMFSLLQLITLYLSSLKCIHPPHHFNI